MSDTAPAATTFPCEGCGANLAFKPGSLSLTCPHCGAVNEIGAGDDGGTPPAPVEELDFRAALAGAMSGAAVEETAVVDCKGCGAQVTLDEKTHSDQCPFCATPLVSTTHRHRHPAVGGVLPFVLDEPTAKGKLTEWLQGLWFAPSKLKDYARAGRPMQGVYIPHYTYDAEADCAYRGQRGDAYYVSQTVTVNGKTETRQVRKIRWSNRSGRVHHVFDDVTVPASDTLFRERIEDGGKSWDLAQVQPYRPEFMAGFRSEAPAIGIEDGWTKAQPVMEGVLRGVIRRDIGGDEQRILSMNTHYSRITFKHLLLPVWLAAYRFQDKSYRIIVNGRTGQVTGERPYSWTKIAAAVLGVLVVIGAAVWFFNR